MIDRELVNLLLEKEAILCCFSEDNPVVPEGVSYVKADLTEFSACVRVCEGKDYVFNVVGVQGSPKMCKEQPADFMVPMLQFNTNMMEAARRAGVKWYLFTSSVGVYIQQNFQRR